jgi:hypothetical protein
MGFPILPGRNSNVGFYYTNMEKLRDSCSFGSVTHAEGCRGDIFEKFSN